MIGDLGGIHTGSGGQNRVFWEVGAWGRSGAPRQHWEDDGKGRPVLVWWPLITGD